MGTSALANAHLTLNDPDPIKFEGRLSSLEGR